MRRKAPPLWRSAPEDEVIVGTGDATVQVHRCAVCADVEELLQLARAHLDGH